MSERLLPAESRVPRGVDPDWPHRERSRMVRAAGLRWHVQTWGDVASPAPATRRVLLLHGTGASAHSFRDLAPLLHEAGCAVLVPDLPGHGFTQAPPPSRLSMPAMAAGLTGLLKALGFEPTLAAGHSAGMAILCRMRLDGQLPAVRRLVGLCAAVLPIDGIQGRVYAPVAKALALTPFLPRLFAWRASDPEVLGRLMASTGSKLDARGLELYGRLAKRPRHVAAALGMMANWDLPSLVRDLPKLDVPSTWIHGENDKTVPAEDSRRAAAMIPSAQAVILPGLGHLAHEEAPKEVAGLMV